MKAQDPTPGISKIQMVNKFLLKKRLPDGDLDPEEYFKTYTKRVKCKICSLKSVLKLLLMLHLKQSSLREYLER